MARNPLSYTNRTFLTIYSEFNALYPDKPEWFKTQTAGLFDILHWYLDAHGQDTNIISAVTPEAILGFAQQLDYFPSGKSPASNNITVTIDTAPQTIAKADLKITATTATGTAYTFEALSDLTISTGTTGVATFYEGATVTNSPIGTSDGVTEWQTFVIPDNSVDGNSISVTCSSILWTKQFSLVNSLGTDLDYRIIRRSDGFYYIMFGNGTYGAIPPSGDVSVSYRTISGTAGNLKIANVTLSYAGTNAHVTGVSTATDFNGGSDGESIETTRFLAPKMIKRNDRCVTQDDYEYVSLKYSSTVQQAKCFPGLYGENTIGIHIIPAGGGNSSSGFKLALQTYLSERSLLGKSDVRVRDPFYSVQNISVTVKIRPDYTFVVAQPFINFALRLMVTEVVKEFLDIYDAGVPQTTVDFINTTWGYTFTINDYVYIIDIVERRKRDGYNTWGDGITLYDIGGTVDSIIFVDQVVSINTPTAPVTINYTEVMTAGTITVIQG